MEKISKEAVKSLINELRQLAPQRPLSYGDSLHVARLQASRLRQLLGIESPDINLAWLIKQKVVPVHFVPSHELNENSGLTTDAVGRKLQVFINESEPTIRQRFSLLHELKHVLDFPAAEILHERLGSGDGQLKGDMIEWIANDFAAHALMPTALVKRAWFQTQDVRSCAILFNVSLEAMSTRLNKLGLTGEHPKVSRSYFRQVRSLYGCLAGV